MLHDVPDKVGLTVAASMASSPVWTKWIQDYNQSVLVPMASVLGIVYLCFRIYYLIKNKGKD